MEIISYKTEPVDMFADVPSTSNANGGNQSSLSDEVQWEYRWSEEDDKIHGPFSSSQMSEWTNNGLVIQ